MPASISTADGLKCFATGKEAWRGCVAVSACGIRNQRDCSVLKVVRATTSVRPGLFHSFRHSFIDALRVANVGDEIKHALLGWSGGGIPAKYGAKDKAGRFRHRLAEAVANVVYTGLDLSHITKRHGVETEIDPND